MKKETDVPDILSDLLYKDLFDALSTQEQEQLDALCREYRIRKPERQQWAAALEEAKQQDWQEAYRHFMQHTHRRRLGVWYRIAVAVLLCLGAGLFWYLRQPETIPVEVASLEEIQPVSPRAIITLANGERVELQQTARRVVEADGTQVQAEDGELVYQEGEDQGDVLYHTLTIPRGGEYRLVLPDGTRVWMNAGSELKFPVHFKGDSRKVFLQGEAYFEVTKQEGKSFIVAASKGEIRVWGTSFNVRDYPEEKKVVTTLESGKVSYVSAAGGREIILQPGYMLEDREGQELCPVKVNTALYCGWKDGKYIFDDLSLEEIMHTLERWYDVTVVYSNESSKALHFTGDLMRYGDIRTILRFIETGGDVSFEIQGKKILVKEK